MVVPGVILAVLVVAYPLLTSAWSALTAQDEGQSAFRWLAENPVYIDILRQTLLTGALTVVMALALGYPYAYLMVLVSPRWRTALLVITLIPFWVSGLVRIFAWVILLQSGGPVSTLLPFLGGEGLLRTQLAVQIGLVQVLLPFMILPLYNSIRTVDPRLMQAAESLGARRSVAFFRVFVPLSLPGVQAGSLVVFILTLGFYVLPQMLGSPSTAMIGNAIYTQASSLGNLGRAGAMSMLLIISAMVLVAAVVGAGRLLGRIGGRR
ncbi:ABC transporter permease subunit [Georgenia thermotolerans]|uniref:ABC transporter permease subunit n=2 Tax=Georgenia thermotolerans TaxID=527326 RepID=A0A7J5UUK2_9MICO|nr:ABC transporter permease subunit [Georgenia thermotolerans]